MVELGMHGSAPWLRETQKRKQEKLCLDGIRTIETCLRDPDAILDAI